VPPSPPAAPVSTSNAPAPSTSTEVLQTPPPPPASVEVAAVAPASDSASALAAAVEAPAAAAESVTNTATTLVDAAAPVLPFQWADLAALGLDTGFPVGTMTKVLAGTHLATGLPWAASIALAALMLRIPVAALQLFSLRRSAPLQLVSKEMEALRRELHAAEARRDVPAERTATVKMQILAQNAGVSLGPTAVVAPIVFGIGGVVLQLGMYNAVWRVCKANIPEFAAHAGAWGWLPDVSAVDPTYILPLANFCAIQLAIHVRAAPRRAVPAGRELTLHTVLAPRRSVDGAGELHEHLPRALRADGVVPLDADDRMCPSRVVAVAVLTRHAGRERICARGFHPAGLAGAGAPPALGPTRAGDPAPPAAVCAHHAAVNPPVIPRQPRCGCPEGRELCRRAGAEAVATLQGPFDRARAYQARIGGVDDEQARASVQAHGAKHKEGWRALSLKVGLGSLLLSLCAEYHTCTRATNIIYRASTETERIEQHLQSRNRK
jgi:hypothetical protein